MLSSMEQTHSLRALSLRTPSFLKPTHSHRVQSLRTLSFVERTDSHGFGQRLAPQA